MAITSRGQLIQYCLTKLGSPVIEINVSEVQLNDRIDDALQYFREYHSEALQRTFMKYKITASHLVLTTNVAAGFLKDEVVVGQTSNANMIVYDSSAPNTIRSRALNGTFVAGETVIGQTSGATAVIAPGGVFIGDIQNRSIPVGDQVMSVSRVLPFTDKLGFGNDYMFDVQYQLHLNTIYNSTGVQSNIQYFVIMQQYLSLLDFTLNTQPSYRFSRLTNQLSLDINWDNVKPDEFLMAEGFVTISPSESSKLYDDIFVKRYATALIKMQWGQNLSKYSGIELPGGIKLDGSRIVSEASAELKELEDQVINKFSTPLGFMVG